MSLFSSECVCALGELAVKNCSIHGGKRIAGHIKYKGKLYAPVVGCATVSGEIEDVDARLGKAVEALREVIRISEDADAYDMSSNAEINMRNVAETVLKEIEGA